MTVKVTQADREAAAQWAKRNSRPQQAANMRRGSCDTAPLVQAFARHRQQALEEAAKVADEYATFHDKHDDGLSGFDSMALGAREVAEEIRALKEEQ